MRPASVLLPLLWIATLSAQTPRHATPALASVPFVGCRSDGQVGPQPAPTGTAVKLPVAADVARQLAFYKADTLAVLAPRGWHCFGTYGSGGASIYVTPQDISTSESFKKWDEASFPQVRVTFHWGGTSGRFTVAEFIARMFPADEPFAKSVEKERKEIFDQPEPLPTRPFPHDVLTRIDKRTIDYVTPAHASGIGSYGESQPAAHAISGVVLLTGADVDLGILALELPPELGHLAPAIKRQFRRDAASTK